MLGNVEATDHIVTDEPSYNNSTSTSEGYNLDIFGVASVATRAHIWPLEFGLTRLMRSKVQV